MFIHIYQRFLRGTPKKDLLFLFLLFACLYWGMSALRPFANPDEGRYVEIPREMLSTGNWVTPRLNGILYFEKPPAFYWLQALALGLGGMKEWVGRFWNCTFAVLGILASYGMATVLYNRRAGVLSALFLGLSPVYFAMGHVITLDMLFSCCIAFGFFAFILGYRQPLGTRGRFLWFMSFYTALSLGVLTKGLVAILVPGAILLLWIILCQEWRTLKHCYFWTGLGLSLLLTLPWHILAALETPEFTYFYLVHEQFLRYLKPLHGRGQPIWFCTAMLFIGFLPGSFVLVEYLGKVLSSRFRLLKHKKEEALLLLWGVFFIGFFSLSKSQLVPYILPSFFPFAILVGGRLDGILEGREEFSRYLKLSFQVLGSALLLLGLVLPAVLLYEGFPRNTVFLGCILSGVLGVLCLCLLKSMKQGKVREVWLWLMLVFIYIAGSCNFLLCYARPSTKPFALYLRPLLQPGDLVFQVYNYYQDFPPYLGQLTGVVDRPDEQRFGLSLEDHRKRYPTEAEFFKKWTGEAPIYALIRAKHLDQFIQTVNDPQYTHILMQDKDYVLLKNQAFTPSL